MDCLFTYIYTLSHPVTGEIRYVGKTSGSLKERLRGHMKEKGETHRSRWINSLKSGNILPIISEVDTVSSEEWKFWECYYISLFKSWGCRLINATMGGEGVSGLKHSQATREKLRIAGTGKRASEETKAKMRMSNGKYWKGKKRSEEDRAKFSKAQTGKKQSEETIRKRSEQMTGPNHHFFGKKLSEDHVAKLWATRIHARTEKEKSKIKIGITKWWAKRKEAI